MSIVTYVVIIMLIWRTYERCDLCGYGGACSPFVWPTRENYSRDHVRRFPTIVHNSGKNGHPVGILS